MYAAFDTLKLARSLRDKAKLTSEQAEGFADAISEAMQSDLATKSDIKELELRLRAGTKASKADIIKWVFGAIGFQTIVVIGAVIALARIFVK